MWLFHFLFWTAVRANEEQLYRKIGDKAVLTPDSVMDHITSIRWKHGPDLAMQWFGEDILSYKQFKDRGTLNISTGAMAITGLTRNLSGIYTPVINGKVTSKIRLLVISPVPKPNLSVSCESVYCVLTCDGSTTDAEPVTYWWTAGDKRWNSTKDIKITKEEKEKWYNCTLENPVSFNSSEKIPNPFNIDWTKILIAVVGGILVVCIIIIFIIIIYFRHKKRRGPDAGTGQERDVMLSALPNIPNEDSTSVVTHSNSNGAATVSEVHETTIQDPRTTMSQDPSNETASDVRSKEHFKPQWQYMGENGGWHDFRETNDPLNKCSVTSDDIQKRYKENPHGKMFFTRNRDSYELDFDRSIQTDKATGYSCMIKRVMVNTKDDELQKTMHRPSKCSIRKKIPSVPKNLP